MVLSEVMATLGGILLKLATGMRRVLSFAASVIAGPGYRAVVKRDLRESSRIQIHRRRDVLRFADEIGFPVPN